MLGEELDEVGAGASDEDGSWSPDTLERVSGRVAR